MPEKNPILRHGNTHRLQHAHDSGHGAPLLHGGTVTRVRLAALMLAAVVNVGTGRQQPDLPIYHPQKRHH